MESLRELFAGYPCHVEMSSISIAVDPTGQAAVTVRLREADPAVLAAGIVEWKRTLSRASTSAWRTPAGYEVHVAIPNTGAIS
ncbi:hypothetical protein [Actinophytocola sediminis]